MDFSNLNSLATRADLVIIGFLIMAVIIMLIKILEAIDKQNKWLMEDNEIRQVGEDVKPDGH